MMIGIHCNFMIIGWIIVAIAITDVYHDNRHNNSHDNSMQRRITGYPSQ